MFTLEQLEERVTAYREGRMSFDEFEEWYRNSSWGFYDRSGDPISEAISAVEAAFSSYEVDGITEEAFRQELADVVLRFALAASQPREIYSGNRSESGNNSQQYTYGSSPQTVESNSSLGFSRV